MEELKRIGRVFGKAASNFLANLTNYRGWGFLLEALIGILILRDFPEDSTSILAWMLGLIILFSLLEIGFTPKYRKGEEWYKFWYVMKGSLASFGLVWMFSGKTPPAEKIIQFVVFFDITFMVVYGKRLAACAWRPSIPKIRLPSFRRPKLFHRQ